VARCEDEADYWGRVCQRRRSRNLLSNAPHFIIIALLDSFNPATAYVTDFLYNESSLTPEADVDRVAALIDSRLFLMVVRGSPQRPFEGARVVFLLLSFGGLLMRVI
jgi:hypothetical protein